VNAVQFLDEAAVRTALQWKPLIATMEKALEAFSSGGVIQPVRTMLTIEEGKRYLGVMAAASVDTMGSKLVSFYPGNAGTSTPTHMAVIVLCRTDTGEPLAVMDGRLITEMRTAAVSAAASKRLAAPNSRALALLGSGVQAAAHLDALSQVFDFKEVRVWSPTPEHAQAFAEAHGALATQDAEAAVRNADIIVVATNAQTAVLRGHWLSAGAHVNAVGAARPTWRELDDAAMISSVLVVDSREAALRESGDVILSKAPIYAEVGEILAGAKPTPPPGQTTVFKSLGLAVEDIAAATLVYETINRRA
jgi:ornithine cyclodeaminase/alanine dehydrogenase-like protein (mu-crystallin family)